MLAHGIKCTWCDSTKMTMHVGLILTEIKLAPFRKENSRKDGKVGADFMVAAYQNEVTLLELCQHKSKSIAIL